MRDEKGRSVRAAAGRILEEFGEAQRRPEVQQYCPLDFQVLKRWGAAVRVCGAGDRLLPVDMRFAPPAILLCALAVACSKATYLDPPRPIPPLAAPNQDGKLISLQEACGGPWAVVFFYPEADTPG